jgi:hypothetical protein
LILKKKEIESLSDVTMMLPFIRLSKTSFRF